jgi:hypothetical protein
MKRKIVKREAEDKSPRQAMEMSAVHPSGNTASLAMV